MYALNSLVVVHYVKPDTAKNSDNGLAFETEQQLRGGVARGCFYDRVTSNGTIVWNREARGKPKWRSARACLKLSQFTSLHGPSSAFPKSLLLKQGSRRGPALLLLCAKLDSGRLFRDSLLAFVLFKLTTGIKEDNLWKTPVTTSTKGWSKTNQGEKLPAG
jgi:hypothetical protein